MHHDRLCVLCRKTLGRAGKAFEGLEALLGGGRSGTFDLQASSLSAHVVCRPMKANGHFAVSSRLFFSQSCIGNLLSMLFLSLNKLFLPLQPWWVRFPGHEH